MALQGWDRSRRGSPAPSLVLDGAGGSDLKLSAPSHSPSLSRRRPLCGLNAEMPTLSRQPVIGLGGGSRRLHSSVSRRAALTAADPLSLALRRLRRRSA